MNYYVVFKTSECNNRDDNNICKDLRAFRTKDKKYATDFFKNSVLMITENKSLKDYYEIDSLRYEQRDECQFDVGVFYMTNIDGPFEWIAFCKEKESNKTSLDYKYIIGGMLEDKEVEIQGAWSPGVVIMFHNRILFHLANIIKKNNDKNTDIIFKGFDYCLRDSVKRGWMPWNNIKVGGKTVAEVMTAEIEEMHGKCFSAIDKKIIE